ncbi:MAG: hypothetical protein ACI8W3_002129 [Myxococcota bacterium]|jgi:hypothetical protein
MQRLGASVIPGQDRHHSRNATFDLSYCKLLQFIVTRASKRQDKAKRTNRNAEAEAKAIEKSQKVNTRSTPSVTRIEGRTAWLE